MISKKTIDEIMMATKIEEVVGEFVSLKKRGQDWTGLCPFHDDKNPSMHVNPRLGIFNCFVCDTKGNAIKFLMEYQKCSYPEALRYLAKKYNIAIEEDAQKTPEELALESEVDSMLALNKFAEDFFVNQLFNTENGRNIGLSYFKGRGLTEDIIKKFRLGYSPESWSAFTDEALKNGFSEKYLLETGLTKKSSSDKIFDFFHGRVMFPIHNALGKTVGFGGRTLLTDKKISKYFNSPESEVYHKSDILYGFYLARKAIRANDNVFLVEGYTDVISMHASGIENVVASSGTALTQGQIKILASQTKNITVLYDGDSAGIKASLRGIDMLLKSNLNVYVVLLPEGEDPDSFARKNDDHTVLEYLKENRSTFIIFKAKILSKDAGSDPNKRAQMVNEILSNIADISDTLVQAFYIKECSELFNLPEESLNAQLRRIAWKKIKEAKQASQGEEQTNIDIQLPPIRMPQTNPEENSATAQRKLVEEKIIILLLKFGMYEIDVEENRARNEIGFFCTRIDQYIFDEFHDQKIIFKNPLFQQIYLEYAQVAIIAQNQEFIQRYFTMHENPEISSFAISSIGNSDPEISPMWETRFDTVTKSVSNNIKKLNNEVENLINMFKLRIVEQYREAILDSLNEGVDTENLQEVLKKFELLTKRRQELAERLDCVITK